MHVLHAIWHERKGSEGLAFWVERSDVDWRQKGGLDKRRHPFAGTVRAVKACVEAATEAEVPACEAVKVGMLLPSYGTGPAPSPYLPHEWDLEEDAPRLASWHVEGAYWTAVEAFHIVQELRAGHAVPPGLRVGPSVRYWQQVFTFVLSQLIQQNVLPALVREQDKEHAVYRGRWEVVLHTDEALKAFEALAHAMPPLCRTPANRDQFVRDARAQLRRVIRYLGDVLVRQWAPDEADLPMVSAHPKPVANWLTHLLEGNGVLRRLEGVDRLIEEVAAWRTRGFGAGDAHVQVAFRLESPLHNTELDATEPQETESPDVDDARNWRLHYALRSRDDLSLLIPAEAIWDDSHPALNKLKRHIKRPQEVLLKGLGYAARLFEPLRRELKTARPTVAALSDEEAFNFLRECAPLLEEAGFAVLTPPWWNKPGSRIGVHLNVKRPSKKHQTQGTGFLSLENLISYTWELSVGDTRISREEFEALVALKSPLVRLRGQWVQLDAAQIEKAIRFWKKHARSQDQSLWDVLPVALGGQQEIDGLEIEGVDMDDDLQAWFDQIRGTARLEALDTPEGLRATLRPYQQTGYAWLNFLRQAGMGACLADDMGLGKTIQTLALLQYLKECGQLQRPVLLVCPTSVVTNWYREAERFTPGLTTYVHQGIERLREEAFAAHVSGIDLVLTSYAIARRDAEMVKEMQWTAVVLDEAQHIKNPDTQQARTMRALRSDFRIALTGTPVENRLSELWSIMQFLNPGYLGSRKRFKEVFARPIEKYNNRDAVRQLRALTQPFILRRLKTDPNVISDLPEKQEMKVYCMLSDEQATLYEAVVRDVLHQIETVTDPMARRGLVLSMLTKLKQVCNHPAQFLHQVSKDTMPRKVRERSGKLNRLIELQEEILAADGRSLLFTQFTEMGHLLHRSLQELLSVPVIFLHGGTPVKKRESMVRQFQDDESGPPIFILSLKAGGTGLNLTRANHVFHFDRWWNPAVENQATDRAFRIGQTQKVMVHKFICTGTLEERIDAMIEHKKTMAEQVVGAGESWITELSTNDLRELVVLRDTLMV